MDLTFPQDDLVLYSLLYTCMTLVFAMAVLSKFLRNEFRFGFRSSLSLFVLLAGEPICHFLVTGTSGLLFFGFGCLAVYSILPAGHLPVDKKNVVITGCDSGFGHAVARKLDSIGVTVYACCLLPEGQGAKDLTDACSSRLKVVKLDVTNDEDIEAMKQLVTKDSHGQGLWGLVNNAGVWYCGEIDTTSDHILHKIIDVNLIGVTRVTRALLPLIRKAKGRIVNVSSVASVLSLEGNGIYAMCKAALEVYSHTLRLEMRKFGVSVSIVQPMGFITGNLDEGVLKARAEETWASLDTVTKIDYGKKYIEAYYSSVFSQSRRFPTDLTPVVRVIRSALMSRRPQYRYPCGLGAGLITFLFPLLPMWLQDRAVTLLAFLPRSVKPACLEHC